MSKPIRRRLEDAFRDTLRDLMPGDTIVSGGECATIEAPYVVVRCARAEETTPGSYKYRFYLRATPVTNINDDGTPADAATTHDTLFQRLQVAFLLIPRSGLDDTNGVLTRGWVLMEDENADDDQNTFADVVSIEGGVDAVPESFEASARS